MSDELGYKKSSNHIEEYFTQSKETSEERASRQIFTAKKEDVDIKTDLNIKEIPLLNAMFLNDRVLVESGLDPCFSLFYEEYLRLKISLDRKSRGEFVSINKRDTSSDMVEGMKTAGAVFGGAR